MTSELAPLFKAASEPVRLEILQLLRSGTLCVCELQARLGLPQPTVSRHLAALRHAGLVLDRRDGPRMLYSLAPAETELGKAFFRLLARACDLDFSLQRSLGAHKSSRRRLNQSRSTNP